MISWTWGQTLEDLEKKTILAALKLARGNQTMAASALGISTRTLYNKLKTYGTKDIGPEPIPEEIPQPLKKVKTK